MAYNKQFKDEAMRLVTGQGYSKSKASLQLGVPQSTLARWLDRAGWRPPGHAAASASAAAAPPSDDPAVLKVRVRELEEENRRLKLEKDILKKATAFFAREQP